jgi:lantibiotic modifying enzyme
LACDAALLFTVADQVWPGQRYGEAREAALERAVHSLDDAHSMGLFGGCAKVAWVLDYAEGTKDDDSNEEFDDQLREFLADANPCGGQYDLISGWVGIGVYALERVHHPAAAWCVGRIVELLEASAQVSERGTTWFTPPERLPPAQLVRSPKGYFNLGVAHGVPGAMAFLARVATAPIASDSRRRARALVENVVRWVLAQERTEFGPDGSFPCRVQEVGDQPGRRPAWCYGDLGIAASLLLAAREVGRADWETKAIAIAHSVAADPGMGAVLDAGLCHGAAGVAHIFNRMYQTAGDPVLGEAARRWFEETLRLRTGKGVGGYQSWMAVNTGHDLKFGWMDNTSFLEGSAGVALALIAATTDQEPGWDRMLLLSGTRAA